MVKDYYLILGVPVDAAPDLIRSAFRRLALQYHPDRGAPSDPRALQDVNEAYEVLSSPSRRARYDRERRVPQPRTMPAPARTDSTDPDPEPLIADPMPITGEREVARPSYEALLDRILRNFSGEGWTKAEHPEPLDFELILTPREASRGIVVPFEVPALSVCPDCGGTGRALPFACDACVGEGRLVERRTLDLTIPAGVRDGASVEVSLESLGVENLWLRVHIRVAPH